MSLLSTPKYSYLLSPYPPTVVTLENYVLSAMFNFNLLPSLFYTLFCVQTYSWPLSPCPPPVTTLQSYWLPTMFNFKLLRSFLIKRPSVDINQILYMIFLISLTEKGNHTANALTWLVTLSQFRWYYCSIQLLISPAYAVIFTLTHFLLHLQSFDITQEQRQY